jgi:hypothetical protein
MLSTMHITQQLAPREWAAWVLNGARNGEPVSRQVIDLALIITGDLALEQKEEPCDTNLMPPDDFGIPAILTLSRAPGRNPS